MWGWNCAMSDTMFSIPTSSMKLLNNVKHFSKEAVKMLISANLPIPAENMKYAFPNGGATDASKRALFTTELIVVYLIWFSHSLCFNRCVTGYSYLMISPKSPPQCVLTTCDPNPCQNGGECLVLENETISSENETIGVLCGCSGGWTGLYCERPPLAKSGLRNWWLIPFFFVLILIGTTDFNIPF